MFTDHPLKVRGIAVCAYMQRPMDTVIRIHYNSYYGTNGGSYIWAHEFHPGVFFPNTRDTTLKNRITDSAILYRVTADGLQKVAAAPWRIEYPHRFIHLPPVRGIGGSLIGYLRNTAMPWTWVENYDQDPVLPLYEVMFDSAVVVEDSFVVASTAFNNEMTPGLESPPAYPSLTETMWLWDHNPTRFYNIFTPYYQDTIPDSTCITWVKYRQMDWLRFLDVAHPLDTVTGDRRYATTHSYPFFPIIELGFDTVLCHEVSNLRVAMRGEGQATLAWNSGDGGPWIVAYGKMEDSWNDFTFDTVTSPTVTLTGLEVGTVYLAVVRGYCSVTDEYGDWSSPLEVEVYHEPQGVEQAGEMGRYVHLMPSPARERVSVVSSFSMSRVAVYDLNGRMVAGQEADGITAVVDVSGLPSGTYIAAIYLPHGVVTKKLVIEN